MASRSRKPKWSFLLVRGPGDSVKQLKISGRTATLVPVAAALTVVGVVAGLELKSLYRIHELESQISRQSAHQAKIANDKDRELTELQLELAELNRQSDDLKTRVSGLQELERKLRQFIERHGEDGVSTSELPDHPESDESMVSAVSNFEELSALVDEMAKKMASNLEKAQRRQAELDAAPSGWPTVSRKLTSGFGYRRDPINGRSAFHAGIDIHGDVGDEIYAAGDGKAIEAGFDSTRGNYIIISHRNGLESWYMHLRRIGVKSGQQVKRGDVIGQLGNTGRSTGPHLHFQIVSKDKPVNPLPYLRLVKED